MVGDRSKVADKLDDLGFDVIMEIDADGNPKMPAMKAPEKDLKNSR